MKGLRAARVLGKKRKPGKHRRPWLSGHAGAGILLDEAPKLPLQARLFLDVSSLTPGSALEFPTSSSRWA